MAKKNYTVYLMSTSNAQSDERMKKPMTIEKKKTFDKITRALWNRISYGKKLFEEEEEETENTTQVVVMSYVGISKRVGGFAILTNRYPLTSHLVVAFSFVVQR